MAEDLNIRIKIDADTKNAEAVSDSIRKINDASTASTAGVDKLTDRIAYMGHAIAGVYAATEVFSFLKSSINDTLELADSLNKLSQKTGQSVDSLYALQAAAKLSDVDMAALQTSLVKFNKSLGEIQTGGGDTAANALKNLGISSKDASGHLKDSNAILLEVSDRFQKMQNGIAKTTLATQLFGKAGANMIPLLNSGKDALTEFAGVLNTEAAQAAERFNDSITRLGLAHKSVLMGAMKETVPILDLLSGKFEKSANNAESMRQRTELLTQGIKAIAEVAFGASYAIQRVGTTFGVLASAAVFAVKGDFALAKEAIKNGNAEIDKLSTEYAERHLMLWDKGYQQAMDSVDKKSTKKNNQEIQLQDYKKTADEAKKLADQIAKDHKEINEFLAKSAASILGPEATKAQSISATFQKELEKTHGNLTLKSKLYAAWYIEQSKAAQEFADKQTKIIGGFYSDVNQAYSTLQKELSKAAVDSISDPLQKLQAELELKIADINDKISSEYEKIGKSYGEALKAAVTDEQLAAVIDRMKGASEQIEAARAKMIDNETAKYEKQADTIKYKWLDDVLVNINKGLDSTIFDALTGKFESFGDWLKKFWSNLWQSLAMGVSRSLSGTLVDSLGSSLRSTLSAQSSGGSSYFSTVARAFGGASLAPAITGSTISAQNLGSVLGSIGASSSATDANTFITSAGSVISVDSSGTGTVLKAGSDIASAISSSSSGGGIASMLNMASSANSLYNLASLSVGGSIMSGAASLSSGVTGIMGTFGASEAAMSSAHYGIMNAANGFANPLMTSASIQAGEAVPMAQAGGAYAAGATVGAAIGYGLGKLGDSLAGSKTQAGTTGAVGGAVAGTYFVATGDPIGAAAILITSTIVGGLMGSTTVNGSGIQVNPDKSFSKYEDSTYSNWFHSSDKHSTSPLDSATALAIQNEINGYKLLLGKLNSSYKELQLSVGTYSAGTLQSDFIPKAFLESLMSKPVEEMKGYFMQPDTALLEKVYGQWQQYAAGTKTTVNEAIAKAFGDLSATDSKMQALDLTLRGFDGNSIVAINDSALAIQSAKDQLLTLGASSTDMASLTTSNFATMQQSILGSNPTPAMIEAWNNLGSSMLGLSGVLQTVQQTIDELNGISISQSKYNAATSLLDKNDTFYGMSKSEIGAWLKAQAGSQNWQTKLTAHDLSVATAYKNTDEYKAFVPQKATAAYTYTPTTQAIAPYTPPISTQSSTGDSNTVYDPTADLKKVKDGLLSESESRAKNIALLKQYGITDVNTYEKFKDGVNKVGASSFKTADDLNAFGSAVSSVGGSIKSYEDTIKSVQQATKDGITSTLGYTKNLYGGYNTTAQNNTWFSGVGGKAAIEYGNTLAKWANDPSRKDPTAAKEMSESYNTALQGWVSSLNQAKAAIEGFRTSIGLTIDGMKFDLYSSDKTKYAKYADSVVTNEQVAAAIAKITSGDSADAVANAQTAQTLVQTQLNQQTSLLGKIHETATKQLEVAKYAKDLALGDFSPYAVAKKQEMAQGLYLKALNNKDYAGVQQYSTEYLKNAMATMGYGDYKTTFDRVTAEILGMKDATLKDTDTVESLTKKQTEAVNKLKDDSVNWLSKIDGSLLGQQKTVIDKLEEVRKAFNIPAPIVNVTVNGTQVQTNTTQTTNSLAGTNSMGSQWTMADYDRYVQSYKDTSTLWGNASYDKTNLASSLRGIASNIDTVGAVFNKNDNFYSAVDSWLKSKGFADGDYTGDGGKYEIAGPAHRGEFIFTQEQTRAIGVPALRDIARNGIGSQIVNLVSNVTNKGSDAETIKLLREILEQLKAQGREQERQRRTGMPVEVKNTILGVQVVA